ncbi:hypothetical protein BKA69DRAFT_1175164 [Paraphysoderma sedebokerense]|nr:hypothetical protein BKA69DRAFT_1175164 [Paraphysoderma sedebokerense]
MTDDPFDENDDEHLDKSDSKIPKTIWKTQKPTLIRPTQGTEKKVVGNMVYNPTLKKWEGNEDALRLFDRQNQVRPNLITNNSRDIPQSVGKMYFDPVKMCWIGNEDEDIFKIMDDEAPSAQSNPSSPAVNTTDDKFAFRVGTEFKLSSQLKNQMSINESLHKSFMSKWCPTEEKRPDRGSLFCQSIRVTHLYDIRFLALSISAKTANK